MPGLVWFDAREQRWPVLVTVVPYVLLAVLAAFTVVMRWSAGFSLLVDLGLCALAAV